jgi:hypothetical protein
LPAEPFAIAAEQNVQQNANHRREDEGQQPGQRRLRPPVFGNQKNARG